MHLDRCSNYGGHQSEKIWDHNPHHILIDAQLNLRDNKHGKMWNRNPFNKITCKSRFCVIGTFKKMGALLEVSDKLLQKLRSYQPPTCVHRHFKFAYLFINILSRTIWKVINITTYINQPRRM